VKKNPTKRDMANAQPVVKAWKSSGNAGRRYKGDTTDAWALACIRQLATMEVAPYKLAERKKYVRNNGDFICLDWYNVHPAMSATTRPDQGFESRMLTNLALADQSVGWAWCQIEGEYYLVRTA